MKTQEEVERQHAVGPINLYRIYQEGYQDHELDDWATFRREAAKDLLVAMTRKVIDDPDQLDAFEPDFYARIAVEWADSLVKHLEGMKKRDEINARIPQETLDRVRKQMSCKWYCNGGDCGKGLPGTPCHVVGCVAWEEHKEEQK